MTAPPTIGPGRTIATCDDQVLEPARLGARQHLDLGAALDLEDADRVADADHVVDRRIVEIDPAQIDRRLVVVDDQLEALLDQREHAQREEIDLDEPRVVAGVLVPLAEEAPLHRGRLNRHQLDERRRGDDHAADMLRDVAREMPRAARPARSGSVQGGAS